MTSKIVDLDCGWSLAYEASSPHPLFERKGISMNPFDFAAGSPDARRVFRSLKKFVDVTDREWRTPGNDLGWRYADRAKISLEMSLRTVGRWSDDLADTGVGG